MKTELTKTMDYLKSQLNDKGVADKLHAYISNLEKQVDYLEDKRLKEKEEYLDTLEKLKDADYQLQNEKKANENNRKVLEGFVKENKALREIVGLWA